MDVMLAANVVVLLPNLTFNDGNVQLKVALDLVGGSHSGDLCGL
jgi:hypothetical protein